MRYKVGQYYIDDDEGKLIYKITEVLKESNTLRANIILATGGFLSSGFYIGENTHFNFVVCDTDVLLSQDEVNEIKAGTI